MLDPTKISQTPVLEEHTYLSIVSARRVLHAVGCTDNEIEENLSSVAACIYRELGTHTSSALLLIEEHARGALTITFSAIKRESRRPGATPAPRGIGSLAAEVFRRLPKRY